MCYIHSLMVHHYISDLLVGFVRDCPSFYAIEAGCHCTGTHVKENQD